MMSYVIWKIFIKQYARFIDATTSRSSSSSSSSSEAVPTSIWHSYPAITAPMQQTTTKSTTTNVKNKTESTRNRPPEDQAEASCGGNGLEVVGGVDDIIEDIGETKIPTTTTTRKLSCCNSNNNNNSNDANNLIEVYVVNDTKNDTIRSLATATAAASAAPPIATTSKSASSSLSLLLSTPSSNANITQDRSASSRMRENQNEANSGRTNIAPIARDEEEDEVDDDGDGHVDGVGEGREMMWEASNQKQHPIAHRTMECLTKATNNISVDDKEKDLSRVQRSKSQRVRTYLKKCRARLTGNKQQQEAATATNKICISVIEDDIERQEQEQARRQHEFDLERRDTESKTKTIEIITEVVDEVAEHQLNTDSETDNEQEMSSAVGIPVDYEDIDFSATPSPHKPSWMPELNSSGLTEISTTAEIDSTDAQQAVKHNKQHVAPIAMVNELKEETTTIVEEDEVVSLETMIDRHLAHIFSIGGGNDGNGVCWPRTRAILIREARDLLVCTFHGCLQTFERCFLCKFAEIAATLRARHFLGETLVWHEGWPLTLPNGALVLHLGSPLEDQELRIAEIYLSVQTLSPSSSSSSSKEGESALPALYAVWREFVKKDDEVDDKVDIVQRRCIDYNEPKAYLSILQIEMLSSSSSTNTNGGNNGGLGGNNNTDELPQLLQSLLVSVERSIERVSLNELQMPIGSHQQQSAEATATIADETNNNHNQIQIVPNSPKCALRRSELITKNKLFSNRYMMRRLTNRQDSMNSTSSGNSCTSTVSSSSSNNSSSNDELLNTNNNNNINNNEVSSMVATQNCVATSQTQQQQQQQQHQQTSSSPALPLFCLGNSFPHIDSDEENSDEKRNSLNDICETELLPPSSINELPEKLLLSGVYLPGTRTLRGDPIVTVDPDCVTSAGLNCYEIATVLLFYSTIPERNVNLNATCHSGNSNKPMASPSIVATSTTITTTVTAAATATATATKYPNTKPAQQTFTILIAIEKSQHLCVIDLICQSLKLLTKQIAYCEILAVCLERHLLQQLCNQQHQQQQQQQQQQQKNIANSTSKEKESLEQHQQQQQQQQHLVKFISVDEVTTSVAPSQIPYGLGSISGNQLQPQLQLQQQWGMHHHDARKWREFFTQLEPFQRQCTAAGQRLVTAMSDIRSADLQGLPTRRQLYAQHRALSRALMDSELHNLRKRGTATLTRLQEVAKSINVATTTTATTTFLATSNKTSTAAATTLKNNNHNNNISSNYSFNTTTSEGATTTTTATSMVKSIVANTMTSCNNSNNNNNNNNYSNSNSSSSNNNSNTTTMLSSMLSASHHQVSYNSSNISSIIYNSNNINNNSTSCGSNNNNINNSNNNVDVAIRLHKVTLLFNEVDRAAKRLEQLTEQRRERLRELTRQRALEDEINEVTNWLSSDGHEKLQQFTKIHLDNPDELKAQEQEFEKYYFISMKHLAKGRDLYTAAVDVKVLRESAVNLKTALDVFAEKLEKTHERIEAATRLHHLLTQHSRETELYEEIQKLAEQLDASALLERFRAEQKAHEMEQERRVKPTSLHLKKLPPYGGSSNRQLQRTSYRSSSGNGSFEGVSQSCHCWRESRNLEDMDELLAGAGNGVGNTTNEEEDGEEEQSKMADSGLGVCDRCEGNPKLTRVCSCQSLNEAANMFEKSHNCDELLDDECFERPTKRYHDIHSPLEANAHLQCHASNLDLPKLEELSCLEPKIQKTLLLIMREMIGTERDYVRSLYYVIENYIDELLRDDIPQPLRGQRNVIFGNIEKIFEFHNSHFLTELERYEHNPLKVGAAFLEMESKFYLYALYNKNKPKSDTLLSEYGTSFFKSKQFELADKMDLASYLLKPVQRMGKYALLLQQLVKACSNVEGAALQEIAEDVEELHRAEEMVKFQLRHGNDLLAMDSLRDCDVNVKEQGRLLRQNEFLVWQGRTGKKTLRQVFLFEDLVLFSKARRFPDHKNLDIYIYKHSIKTSDIGLTAHAGDSPTKFEIWFRKRKIEDTWTLQCMSEDIKNVWTEEISKLLWKQAKRNRDIRLAEMSSMGIGSKPCLDIRPSNNQINDRSITISQLNKTPKLRHSFVGLHAEQGKASMRRPNSLISECSLSSGTSSSSLSTGSSSGGGVMSTGHEGLGGLRHSLNFGRLHTANNNNHGLELINETQALSLSNNNNNPHNNEVGNSNTLSSNGSSSSGGSGSGLVSANNKDAPIVKMRREPKRSTTLVSQLSMESGIVSDISMTPEQELAENSNISNSGSGSSSGKNSKTSIGSTTSPSPSLSAASSMYWSQATGGVTNTVILRRYKSSYSAEHK